MNCRSLLTIILCVISATLTCSGDALQDITRNPRLAGGNLVSYPYLYDTPPALSAAPEGYVPFHIEHYGRHGSRWLLKDRDYTRPLNALKDAEKAGVLTDLGREVLQWVKKVEKGAQLHYGDLTETGALQHRGIAQRMFHNFPEVFSDSARVDAKSTVVIRCILSMTNELVELARLNPQLRITQESSKKNQWYLQNSDRDTVAHAVRRTADPLFHEFAKRHSNPAPLMTRLFTDSKYVDEHVDSNDLFAKLFELASNQQSHGNDTSLYRIFTPEELYHQWVCNNAGWYLSSGNAPATLGRMPYTQRYLLANFIESADSAIADGGNSATLRFGHESVVLPMVCFMEMNDYGKAIDNIDDVAAQWHNYNIFPMASNIQLIFYKNDAEPGNIIVRALLNEEEVSLPVKPFTGNYYRWDDIRKYYTDKINQFNVKFKE